MFLDERGLQNESFNFIVGNDEFNVGNLFDQLPGLNPVTEFAGAA